MWCYHLFNYSNIRATFAFWSWRDFSLQFHFHFSSVRTSLLKSIFGVSPVEIRMVEISYRFEFEIFSMSQMKHEQKKYKRTEHMLTLHFERIWMLFFGGTHTHTHGDKRKHRDRERELWHSTRVCIVYGHCFVTV